MVGGPTTKHEFDVQIGPFKTRVKQADIRLPEPGEDEPVAEPRMTATGIRRAEVDVPSIDFDLRGWRVDEVLHESGALPERCVHGQLAVRTDHSRKGHRRAYVRPCARNWPPIPW